MAARNKLRSVRISHVGAGAHSRSSLFPTYRRLEALGEIELVSVLEIAPTVAAEALRQNELLETQVIAVPDVESDSVARQCSAIVRQHLIDADVDLLVIETPPEAHEGYIETALLAGVHVYCDKPVTAHANSISSESAATSYLKTWERLAELRQQSPNLIVVIGAHRRREPTYLWLLHQLREIADEFDQQVTDAELFHSDGQFRTLEELSSDMPHGFTLGAGKLVHSGSHFLDFLGCAIAAGTPHDRLPDHATVSARLTTPGDLAQLITPITEELLLGKATASRPPSSQLDLGEVDAKLDVSFHRDTRPGANASVTLMHSGVSDRTWRRSNKDTYRQNGRRRMITGRFVQPVLQMLTIESCQATQPGSVQRLPEFDRGGLNHCEITQWRGGGAGPPGPRTVGPQDLDGYNGSAHTLFHDRVKASLLLDVIQGIRSGTRSPSVEYADISEHGVAPALTSAAYLSHLARQENENPEITVPVSLPRTPPPAIEELNHYQRRAS